MTDRTSDDGFLEELERTAKSLSVVTDQASADELRRLFSQLHDNGPAGLETVAGEGGGTIEIKDRGRAG